jgi:predicted permease
MSGIFQDLRYALRQLRKSPGFTATAILMLALGIGGNTSIFQLLSTIRLRTLPVQNPQELAEVKIVGGNGGMGINQQYGELTQPLWREVRDKQQAFFGMFAWSLNQRYVGRGSEMRHFNGLWVSGGFFPVLGVRPWRGRLLMPDDEGMCPVTRAVASYSYWQRELGGQDLAAGIKLVADNDLVEIVGVTPPNFFGMAVGQNFDLALPFCQPKEGFRRDVFELSAMGRLKPGWTIQRASADLSAVSAGIFEATVPPDRDPDTTETYKRFQLAAYPASTGVSALRDDHGSLGLLLAITGLVLLIACANLAGLILARTSRREREIAVRMALGAGHSRLLQNLLVESVLLAGTGAMVGLGVSTFLSRALVWAISTQGDPVNLQIVTDWRVLLFATAATVVTCLIFGVLPAVRAIRSEPLSTIKARGRGTTMGRERFSLQQGMVMAQISISLVLLVGALLFVGSFRNLLTLNPGMRESGITVAFLGFWQSHLQPQRWASYETELLNEIRSVPGVRDAAISTHVPLVGGSWEHGVRVGATAGTSKFTWVSPDYFEAMEIPVLRGRGFGRDDTASSPRVAIVNETFVRDFLGGANPIGHTLRTNPEPHYPSTVYEIVGVIPDTRYNDLRSTTPPMTFAPASQFPAQGPWGWVMIRSDMPPAAIAAGVKRTLAKKYPDVLTEFTDFQQQIRDGLIAERLMAMLSGFFGLLAVLLTTVGLYGVISYVVAQRRNEIGLRMALGADRGQVVVMVMREAARLLGVGVLTGTALSLVVGRSAGSLLFELKPYDLPTLLASIALLTGIAVVASFLPARRAAKVDPMVALRYE